MARGKWKNVWGDFHKTKKAALRAARKLEAFNPTQEARVVRAVGRRKPWGKKYEGWRVQDRRKTKKQIQKEEAREKWWWGEQARKVKKKISKRQKKTRRTKKKTKKRKPRRRKKRSFWGW